jgi:hypothetical protein
MRRPLTHFSAALILLVLMLTFSLSFTTPTAKAVQPLDKCEECQRKVQAEYDRCIAKNPTDPRCGDNFNEGIVHCYRHWCEQ